jgi:hypothetical protein
MEVQRSIFDLVFDLDIPNSDCISDNINARILKEKLVNSLKSFIVELEDLKVQCVIINNSEDKKTVRNREEESAVDY